LILQKPPAMTGKPPWFEEFYADGGAAAKDRKLFSH